MMAGSISKYDSCATAACSDAKLGAEREPMGAAMTAKTLKGAGLKCEEVLAVLPTSTIPYSAASPVFDRDGTTTASGTISSLSGSFLLCCLTYLSVDF
jgi:hypothetical protein